MRDDYQLKGGSAEEMRDDLRRRLLDSQQLRRNFDWAGPGNRAEIEAFYMFKILAPPLALLHKDKPFIPFARDVQNPYEYQPNATLRQVKRLHRWIDDHWRPNNTFYDEEGRSLFLERTKPQDPALK